MNDMILQHSNNARQRRRQNKRAREGKEGDGDDLEDGRNGEGDFTTQHPSLKKRTALHLSTNITNNYGTNCGTSVRINQW